MANPYLEVESGAEAKRYELEIGTDDVVIGRSTDCNWVISSGAVSRRHARIRRQSGAITIEDLGSSNGTFVNGVRLSEPKALGNKDSVKFGSVEAHFIVPQAEPDAGATVSLPGLQAEMAATQIRPGGETAPPPAADRTGTGTGTSATPSSPTRVEPVPSSETSFRPAPAQPPPAPAKPAPAPPTAAPWPQAGPSFIELAAIAAGTFVLVFGVGALLVRFVF